MAKKQSTQAPEYGSYGSYKLTDDQLRNAIKVFGWDFLEEDTDDKAAIFLAILRCFTFTISDTERETLLIAAESMMMPHTHACEKAIMRLSIEGHRAIIGGTQ
jgi:hypothetical protein